jgi:hypothetical protein
MITVTDAIRLAIDRIGTNVSLTWTGGVAPFVLERTAALPPAWNDVLTTGVRNASVPITNAGAWFRLRGQ